jgi:hypothetical protein
MGELNLCSAKCMASGYQSRQSSKIIIIVNGAAPGCGVRRETRPQGFC